MKVTKKLNTPTMRTAALATVFLAAAISAAQTPKTTRDLTKGNTLYVVPYAHLDTQWRWAYPQVIREYIAATLHKNFDLFEKYPHYVFNFSGSRRYEMMREYYPAEYEKLKGYIKAGRWFPCGSSVDEGDANVPSAESLVRHVLYGNRYFRHEFGTASHEFMLPDCFGFPYALPTILAHCGIKGFSTQKLTWGSAVGIPFKVGNWIGPDGKSVVAALDPGSYGADVTEDLSQNTSWLARIQNTGKLSGAYVDYHYYGTGDIGGSPRDSAVNWVEKSIQGTGPVSVVSSRADEMFNSLTPDQIAKLPKYQGELLLTQHSAGSVTSEAYMKRWNRKNELLADAAERASVTAMWLGATKYPSERLYSAWDLVLGSQMHDMLPGTSIPKAYEFCWNDELLALNQFAAVTTDAVGAVTASMDTTAQGTPLVVYNPLSIDREDVVEANVPTGAGDISVFGPDGKAVPTQVLSKDGGTAHILFLAKAPATGFVSYDARTVPSVGGSTSDLKVAGNTIENDRLKVTINNAGDIASVFDKTLNKEMLKAPARLAFQYHNPAQFPAWNMDWEDQSKPPRGYVDGPAKIRIVEKGPVRVAIEIEREAEGSKFVQQVRLTSGGDKVEVANKIDWRTKECALKATFPLTSGNPYAAYDLQVGVTNRPTNDPQKYEVPQHQWIDLTKTDGNYGVGILNDCKYGSDKPDDDTIRLTMIYTPGVRGGYQDQATQDFGRHDILFALQPHEGDWRKGGTPWAAKRLNQPLKAFSVPGHAGAMGKQLSMFRTNTAQVEISAIKKAEDSDEVVVRLRELQGQNANNVEVHSGAGITAAREMNGQEQPLAPATVRDGVLLTSVPAFSLKTFALKLAKPSSKGVAKGSQSIDLAFDTDVASTDGNRTDGSMDSAGRTIAAEQFPKSLILDGVGFKFGSTADGAKNALVARGQTINIPTGMNKVYVLASSSNGDVNSTFRVGGSSQTAVVQDWGGYIGQWDNRLWAGDVGPNYTNYGEMAGLVPAFEKRSEVAWYSSHRHHPTAGNEHYQYSYMFKYGFDVPAGATSITLPDDARVHVFAISAAKEGFAEATPAHPLYDDLSDHNEVSQPLLTPAGGTFNDATTVTIQPPHYWRAGGLHYTIDGSEPNASSPVYTTPIILNDPTTIKVVEIDADGKAGPVTSANFDVHDTSAPTVTAVTSPKVLGLVRVQFSERVTRESAENPANYKFSSAARVSSAKLSPDGRAVELTLDSPLAAGQTESLTVSGVRDMAKAGNTISAQSLSIEEHGAVFTAPPVQPRESKAFPVQNLPVKASDPWTLNFFCRIDKMPDDLTLIAGFGRATDGRVGTGRYFAKFQEGINFWICDLDVQSKVPLDLNKWQMLTATFDGTTVRLYKNGDEIAAQQVQLSNDQAQARIMPLDAWDRKRRFEGEVRDFTIWDLDLSPSAVKRLWEQGKTG